MSPTRRGFIRFASAGAVPGVLVGVARAQSSGASKALTIVVPFAPGGSADASARALAPALQRALDLNVIVENVAGAGGALGVKRLLKAAPDGRTLLCGGLSETLLVPLINPAAGYRPDELVPVAMIGTSSVVIVGRADLPASTPDELIALARRQPGRLTYGSAGVGSFAHVMAELIKQRTATFMVHIPYRGGSQVLADVIGAQLDLAVTSTATAQPVIAQRSLKAIGVSSHEPLAALPGVPTLAASKALQGLEMQAWSFLFAPPGTPPTIVNPLNDAINRITQTAEMRQLVARVGAEPPRAYSPAEAGEYLRVQRRLYEPVARTVKLE